MTYEDWPQIHVILLRLYVLLSLIVSLYIFIYQEQKGEC